MSLAEACKHHPFSNGTEGEAWMSVWCDSCVHDHGFTFHGSCGQGCDLLLGPMIGDFPSEEFPWPEAWLPEPEGSFSLPSRLVCLRYQPCDKGGECDGTDPHAETRAANTLEVQEHWRVNV